MVQVQPLVPQTLSRKLAETARVQAWWSYKFSPVLATFYATVCYLGAPVWPLVPKLLLLLAALVVGATYVSVINDWTDQEDDRLAGKHNRVAGKSKALPATILVFCLVAGLGMGYYFWQWSPTSTWLYLGAWVAFSLYSLPPFRFKKRGLVGVLADASGSHFFPQMLTVSLASAWVGHALPGLWYGAVGAWALACGLRNILMHQLDDAQADEEAGVNTWVRICGPRLAQRLGQMVIFPVEVLGFAGLLVLSRQVWPVALLGVYLALEGFKWRLWGNRAMILEPQARMLLNNYYEVFYPLAFLLVLSFRHPVDSLVLGLHVLLFAGCFWETTRQLVWAASLTVRKSLGL
ncbi:UbiA family prenyltransferase [Hymenobacter persicinus]|uniref:Prenyltransferase n=1 Tax=Hymenobacter persicinus TaxID=2025506 RepID=A0A4Q5LCS8_9BACT|nr:UbiA family prenyltransferase [Hymenobacter persicinus]RYU79426.1 hypothetical protein EWM57_10790 [Hymenobacter persicinus]